MNDQRRWIAWLGKELIDEYPVMLFLQQITRDILFDLEGFKPEEARVTMLIRHKVLYYDDNMPKYHTAFDACFVAKELTKYKLQCSIVFSREHIQTFLTQNIIFVSDSYGKSCYLDYVKDIIEPITNIVVDIAHECSHLKDYLLMGWENLKEECIREEYLVSRNRPSEIRANAYGRKIANRFMANAYKYKDWYAEPSTVIRSDQPWRDFL